MLRIFAFAFSFCLLSFELFAQQEARYSHFLFNKLAINPAYAGSRDGLSTAAVYRHQWTGIGQAPRTLSLSIHAPLANNRVALGAQLVHDQIGLTQSTGLYGDYAYRLPLGNGHLAMGLQAGLVHLRMDLTRANPLDANDPMLQANSSRWLPNAGVGIYYHNEDFFAGLSAPQLLQSQLNGLDFSNARQSRYYTAMAGYSLELNSEMRLHPQALLLYTEGAPAQAELNLSLLMAGRFWTGLGYRSSSTAVLNLAYELPSGLRIGYAYDLVLGSFGSHTGGSHEVLIGLDMGRKASRFYHPRQLPSPVF